MPICGSAAKHAAPAKKQNAMINPVVFVFMPVIEWEFLLSVNLFPRSQLVAMVLTNDELTLR
ncbi:MAG: hypothetical protein DME33_03050 [Verrucomicrobia bacterium]|nr:MAG: hypothetical protein DME33_03050 [Verrucomicrobiota bacterium]